LAQDKSAVGNSKSGDPYGTAYTYLADKDFPRDITVISTLSKPTLNNSTRISLDDGLYVHHTLYADVDHKITPFATCEKSKPRLINTSVFMAGGLQESSFRFESDNATFKSGYYIGKDNSVLINVDIVNYFEEARDIYMVSEVEYLPGLATGTLQAEQHSIDLGLCDSQNGLNIQAPKGQTKWSLTGSPILVAEPGWLVNFSKNSPNIGYVVLLIGYSRRSSPW
jgi:hypothetical protein